MFRLLRAAPLVLLTLLLSVGASAADVFNKSDCMIPMRDGIKLHTVFFAPKVHPKTLPILFMRTPYGVPADEHDAAYTLESLLEDGYILAFQDIRGRFKSEGEFVMIRPPRDRSDKTAIDESTDAYDSIEWMVKNVPGNNRRVGMFGVSYSGWLVTMALLDPHPALKAASEQASPSDMYLGDDFHHNGAFRLSYGFEYAAFLETAKDADTDFVFDRADAYQAFLELGPLTNANKKYFHGKMPTWNNFLAHPNYDEFWQKRAFAPYINGSPKVPNLNVAGWWDQEDFHGPVEIYELFEKYDPNHLNYLVVGPWNHGGWRRPDGSKLGEIPFDSKTSDYFRQQIEAPWFAYWLHDKGSLNFAEATVFQTGTNRWERRDSWPPAAPKSTNLYIGAAGKLSFDAPTDDQTDTADTYLSDPFHPIPYRHRPIGPTFSGGAWRTWLVEDQRFVENRPDVLTWQTEPLQNDLTVAGDIVAQIYAATTGSDADWVVKLIDVYPEHYPKKPTLAGYRLMIADEILRGRFRESFERPAAITPGVVTRYQIDLHTNDHAFLKGHCIMVQIQSTWFPLYDLNPQTFIDNIFTAHPSDFQKATHKIFHSPRAASRIVLPLAQ